MLRIQISSSILHITWIYRRPWLPRSNTVFSFNALNCFAHATLKNEMENHRLWKVTFNDVRWRVSFALHPSYYLTEMALSLLIPLLWLTHILIQQTGKSLNSQHAFVFKMSIDCTRIIMSFKLTMDLHH